MANIFRTVRRGFFEKLFSLNWEPTKQVLDEGATMRDDLREIHRARRNRWTSEPRKKNTDCKTVVRKPDSEQTDSWFNPNTASLMGLMSGAPAYEPKIESGGGGNFDGGGTSGRWDNPVSNVDSSSSSYDSGSSYSSSSDSGSSYSDSGSSSVSSD